MSDSLDNLRNQIDMLDEELVAILAQRMERVRAIGHYKKQHDLAALDTDRWQKIMAERLKQAEHLNLSPELVQKLYELIHSYALKLEAESK